MQKADLRSAFFRVVKSVDGIYRIGRRLIDDRSLGNTVMQNSMFFLNSILFGVGLAVDAFLVALANGLHFPTMRVVKTLGIAAMFSIFQLLAVMLGWIVAHTAFKYFDWIEVCFSWVAVAVIAFLGVKMLVGAIKNEWEEKAVKIGFAALAVQSAATSVDALTVGFTIEEYGLAPAIICSAIIASVTFILYAVGFIVGKKFGMRFEKAASIIGGLVFLAIAVEILVTTYI